VIRSIELHRQAPFEPDSVGFGALGWAYRTLNTLHVRTRPSFIRRELLMDVGDCYDDLLVSESERLLDRYPFLESARITAESDASGARSLTVRTRDAWSTTVGLGLTYDNGVNLESFGVTETNLLGRGLLAAFSHREFRELRAQSLRLATPRLFGRTDASVQFGRDRPGRFFNEYLRYPFLGDAGRYAVRQGYSRGTTYFAYATPDGDGRSQILVPAYREVIELSAAERFGEAGRSIIVGLTLSRDVNRFHGPEATIDGDLDEPRPIPPDQVPDAIAAEIQDNASSRLWLHLGVRRIRYEDVPGLDALQDDRIIGVGMFAGVSVGRGFDVLTPHDVRGLDDVFARARLSYTTRIGSSLVHGSAAFESRYDDGAWRDQLGGAELVAYLRTAALPAQTLFLRSSLAGGRRTTAPFQLSLGGRESVRSLPEDAFPGGRSVRFVLEDRITLPWPAHAFDLGLTLFGDAGRVWPGDAPLGVDSGWQYAVGAGVRFAIPAGSRYAWRADLAFPAGGTRGDPVFRLTAELNGFTRGFFTPDLVRSTRFRIGAESF
jgi:hypothetical protein